MERKNAWKSYSEQQLTELEVLARKYREFLDHGKTERECVCAAVELAKAAGYRDLEEVIAAGDGLKAGDKVYAVNMKKSIALFHIGSGSMEQGLRILGAHIDSPRLDLKQNPLYEDTEMALLDTHYYGGIKKYQWVTIPLALHGVVAKKDGSVIELAIGEKEDDPVLCISDLLIHLAGKQMEKKATEVVEGENLDEDEINDYITEHFAGDCLLAVGDEDLIKIHFHTNEPWKLLEYAAGLGEIYDIVVEDMDRQSRGLQG